MVHHPNFCFKSRHVRFRIVLVLVVSCLYHSACPRLFHPSREHSSFLDMWFRRWNSRSRGQHTQKTVVIIKDGGLSSFRTARFWFWCREASFWFWQVRDLHLERIWSNDFMMVLRMANTASQWLLGIESNSNRIKSWYVRYISCCKLCQGHIVGWWKSEWVHLKQWSRWVVQDNGTI